MNRLRKSFGMILICAILSASGARTRAQAPIDGQDHIFHDALLDNLVGDWKLTRNMHGQKSEHTLRAEWVLNHQFLQLHMRNLKSESPYEAMVFIGYDNISDRYIAHWVDIGGGRWSETLGYGVKNGVSIKFTFEYPDGPFSNTLSWDATSHTWTFLMLQRKPSGAWNTFAVDNLGH